MNKKGFTLIELLAVIIILGILMIIAIPSVTRYISDSRKSAYIDTAKEIIGGARNLVNSGKLEMYDTDTSYYIPVGCIKTENALKSPYGEFTSAYVGVTYTGKDYKYYWISVDETGTGINELVSYNKLDSDLIKSDLKKDDIDEYISKTSIGLRSKIKIANNSCVWERDETAENKSNVKTIEVQLDLDSTLAHQNVAYGEYLTYEAILGDYASYHLVEYIWYCAKTYNNWELLEGVNTKSYSYIIGSNNWYYAFKVFGVFEVEDE